MISFWRWLTLGGEDEPGIFRVINIWLIVHLFIGIDFSLYLPVTLEKAANNLLLPLAGIFIGLSFAWGGNAQALLQTKEINEFANYHKGGFIEYIYMYQLSVLIILITLILWGVAGLGIFDRVWPVHKETFEYKCIVGLLFFWSSLTLRECWHVVLSSQMLLIVKSKVQNKKKN